IAELTAATKKLLWSLHQTLISKIVFDARCCECHTDCLIQIVKERHACRVEEAHITLLTSKVKRLFSLFFRRPLR
ncbi:hypothetical protein ACSZN6_15525, partial [Aeromonas hydrophila]